MANIEHKTVTAANVHSPYRWIVADAAARNALTADGSYDRYKICLQEDTGQTWRMATTTPSVTWELVADAPGTSAAGITAHKAESGAHASQNVSYDNAVSGLLAANIKAAIDELSAEKADNPMTTAQDLIVGGASGAPARLAVGTNGHVLTVTAGAVGWAAPTGGMTNPMTTQGDIITGGASGAPGRLALGTSGHFLKAGATDPAYAAIVANDVSDATTPGKAMLTAADVAAQRAALLIPTGPLSGFRNTIINGNFGINQRAVSGTVTLAAGEYGHDRWKAGAGGCTYTFATSANVTTITITAGTLLQVIEGFNLQSGTYVLTWSGTAQARIDAGAYGNTGITGTATGGTNQTIEFGTGTVSKVQYETGSIASAFELRPIGTELSLCYRYFFRLNAAAANTRFALALVDTTTLGIGYFQFPVTMRVAPSTLTQSGTATDYKLRTTGGAAVFLSSVPTLSTTSASISTILCNVASGLTAGQSSQLLSDNANAYLGWSAEL